MRIANTVVPGFRSRYAVSGRSPKAGSHAPAPPPPPPACTPKSCTVRPLLKNGMCRNLDRRSARGGVFHVAARDLAKTGPVGLEFGPFQKIRHFAVSRCKVVRGFGKSIQQAIAKRRFHARSDRTGHPLARWCFRASNGVRSSERPRNLEFRGLLFEGADERIGPLTPKLAQSEQSRLAPPLRAGKLLILIRRDPIRRRSGTSDARQHSSRTTPADEHARAAASLRVKRPT